MNLQNNKPKSEVVATISIIDGRGWHVVKNVFIVTLSIFQPIVLGALLDSLILQILGFIFGIIAASMWAKSNPLDRKFQTREDAQRYLDSLDLPEGERTRLH